MGDYNFAINVNCLSKTYSLRRNEALNLLRRQDPENGFMALKDITLKIKKGESFGIIGKNGSGKSTLLQILAGILKQTNGSFNVRGRIASILELGSGFDPNFTGKENIYLNCSLIGLSKKEIDKNYERILDFAEIGDFIDKPVKKYSTGMLMRLAFAVIVNIKADVLLVDEALSVGDIYFTQKCLRFFDDFKKSGTLVIVTHDLQILGSICDRAALISNGEIKEIGSVKKVIDVYLNEYRQEYSDSLNLKVNNYVNSDSDGTNKSDNKLDLKRNIKIYSGCKKTEFFRSNPKEIIFIENSHSTATTGELVEYKIILDENMKAHEMLFGLNIRNSKGLIVVSEILKIESKENISFPSNTYLIKIQIPFLVGGEFTIEFGVAKGNLSNHEFLQMIYDYERWYVSHKEGDFGLVRTDCNLSAV